MAEVQISAIGESLVFAADAPTARTAIGAGTSSLILGTTAGTALAGNGNAASATTAAACSGNAATATSATTAAACSGNAATATQWVGGRTITLSGAIAGVSPAWTGSANLAFSGITLTPAAAVANCTVAADGTSAGTQLNALLVALRTGGFISP